MNKLYKTIIIDDELLARKRIIRLLETFSEKINIVAEAENGIEAIELIDAINPDLIFLDIEMPGLNGLEVLKKTNAKPLVIFTTAYDQYAISAFEENSIDYLLKPIEPLRLKKTIEKLERFTGNQNFNITKQVESLLDILNKKRESKVLAVKIGDRTLLLKHEEIVYFEAKDKYVSVFTEEAREYVVDHTIASLEDKLPDNFLRVHRAYIINTEKIKEMHRGFNSTHIFSLVMSNPVKISSGRSYNEIIKAFFQL